MNTNTNKQWENSFCPNYLEYFQAVKFDLPKTFPDKLNAKLVRVHLDFFNSIQLCLLPIKYIPILLFLAFKS